MLSIGQFAKACGVTTKTLRYYDAVGLLKPCQVNPQNGYRYYCGEQVKTVWLINRLKQYDCSLLEIKTIVQAEQYGSKLAGLLHRKEREIKTKIKRYQGLYQILQEDIYQIERCGSLVYDIRYCKFSQMGRSSQTHCPCKMKLKIKEKDPDQKISA